jgi:peroxiredoxin
MKYKSFLQSIFITVLTCFTLLSCNGGENEESSFTGKGFIIEGTFKNKLAGQKVSIDELLPSGLKAFDSTKTDEEGNFTIKGTFNSRSFFLLRYDGGDIPIYLDSVTKIKVIIDSDKKEIYEVKGSEENKKLKELVDIGREHFKKLDDLQKRYPKMPTDDSSKQVVMTEFMSIMNGRKDKIMKMITEQPASAAGVFGAMFMLPTQDLDLPAYIREEYSFYETLDKKYEKQYKGLKHYDMLHDLIESAGATAIGRVMSDINLPDPKGEMIKLSSMRGQYVLVDFWASWCRPCRMENPNVVKAYKKYHSKGFEILGVSLDDNSNKWKTAIEADNLTWKHVSELKGWQSDVCRKYNINSIPFSILLDKEGKIVATNLRGEELDKKLKELLGE